MTKLGEKHFVFPLGVRRVPDTGRCFAELKREVKAMERARAAADAKALGLVGEQPRLLATMP